jgi:hypothetical protein
MLSAPEAETPTQHVQLQHQLIEKAKKGISGPSQPSTVTNNQKS